MTVLEFEAPLVELHETIAKLKAASKSNPSSAIDKELESLETHLKTLQHTTFSSLNTWQMVQLSRHPDRPYFSDYSKLLFSDTFCLAGDRAYSEDEAVTCMMAHFEEQSVMVIGQQKGRSTKDKVRSNFGMAHPEGYRKAVRAMKLAERFGLPLICFIDTPGAYPGLEAEQRGQSEAIATSIYTMCELSVPSISVVIGEGGSGGALALGVADRVLMMSYATYSVITPEGCASILWRDAAHAPEASKQLKLSAPDALSNGIIDSIIEEPLGGAHRSIEQSAHCLASAISQALADLNEMSPLQRRTKRYEKFRSMGYMQESSRLSC